MIASSTTMPMARVSASRVKLLMEKPMKYMMANAATMDVGIARPGMIVARRLRRKMKMMTTTRQAAMQQRLLRLLDGALHEDRLVEGDVERDARAGAKPGSGEARRWMAFDTEMMLDLDWRTTPMATAGVPLKRSALRSSSGPSSTRPRSLSLTRIPSVLLTTRLPNSSGVLSSPSERTVNSRRSDSMRPAGHLDVAGPDGLLDVLHREAPGGELGGGEPDPHGEAALPEDPGLPYPGQASAAGS